MFPPVKESNPGVQSLAKEHFGTKSEKIRDWTFNPVYRCTTWTNAATNEPSDVITEAVCSFILLSKPLLYYALRFLTLL